MDIFDPTIFPILAADGLTNGAVYALLAADPQGRLVETLEAYLREGGAGSAAAKALHIHRTTLYYRLDRVREITGLDLDDGDVRMALQLGLGAHRLLTARGVL